MQNINAVFNIYVSNFITFAFQIFGDLSEWSNEQAWKVCIRASVSRVRIPQSPH
jgi:hypothetical protein